MCVGGCHYKIRFKRFMKTILIDLMICMPSGLPEGEVCGERVISCQSLKSANVEFLQFKELFIIKRI